VKQETREHGPRRQQIGAAGDVRDGFGRHRMHGEDRRREARRRPLRVQPAQQRVHQQRVARV
jgi:hypothetical protein